MRHQSGQPRGRGHATVAGVAIATILVGIAGMVGWRLFASPSEIAGPQQDTVAVPVEVAEIRVETLFDRRGFTGSLVASAESTLAPKVVGRIVEMPLDLADPVSRGDIIAVLDSDEFEQLVVQAEADLAVAAANVALAATGADLSSRELERVRALHASGDAPESELDRARTADAAAAAEVRVAEAQQKRAEAAFSAAEIRRSYATIRAQWTDGDDSRVVSALYVEVGDTVGPNSSIATIIELDPIEAVFFVTERDYASLHPGLNVNLTTDAFPGRSWEGEIARVSPSFREGSRQARIEVTVPNPNGLLKPGMFVRVEAILGSAEHAAVVPASAIVERGGETVVFMVDGSTARMIPVTPGIRDGAWLEIRSPDLSGHVVTLGQHLLDDGSNVTVGSGG